MVKYITDQEEHHRTTTFQGEFRDFLRRHEAAFDETISQGVALG